MSPSPRRAQYDKGHEIIETIERAGSISGCSFGIVQDVQTATYQLAFFDLALASSSHSTRYTLQHQSCIRTANLVYDGVKQEM